MIVAPDQSFAPKPREMTTYEIISIPIMYVTIPLGDEDV